MSTCAARPRRCQRLILGGFSNWLQRQAREPMIRTASVALLGGVVCTGPACTGVAWAEDVADFYKAKTFTVVVGHEVGTGFDIYARTLARHLGRHIPGNPAVVVQNMNGASGITAAN